MDKFEVKLDQAARAAWMSFPAPPFHRSRLTPTRSCTFNHMLDQQGQMMDKLAGALETTPALINSMPAHFTLLDDEGMILDVNDHWRHFGIDNGYRDEALGIGCNYLAICVSVMRDSAGEALASGEEFRTVAA